MVEARYGYCECGCGQKTQLAEQTRVVRGWVKGEPKRFILGHAQKLPKPRRACSEEGCDRDVLARGLCAKHYQQRAKARDPERFRAYDRTWKASHRGRVAELARARYANDPTKHIEQSRRGAVKKKYGLTLDEYEAIIARGCAICGSRMPRLALDHCHATGQIRDCLCSNCNNGLGRFADDPARLRAAADYLEKHRRSAGLDAICPTRPTGYVELRLS